MALETEVIGERLNGMALVPLSLGKNVTWALLGNCVYVACQWGMLVALAKIGSPEMVGKFALGLAVTGPVMMLTSLQLRGVQSTDARAEYQFRDYLALRLIGSLLALLIIVGLIIWARYPRETGLIIFLVGVAKAIESTSDILYGFFQLNERLDRIAKSLLLRGPLSCVAFGLGVYSSKSVVWAMVWLVGTWFLTLVLYDFRAAVGLVGCSAPPRLCPGVAEKVGGGSLSPRWEPETLIRLACLALPVGITMMLNSLSTNIPRYLIERYQGEGELGIFAAMAYLVLAGNTVVGALGQSAAPKLAKHFANSDMSAFTYLLLKVLMMAGFLGLIGISVAVVAGREMLALLYGPEYAKSADLLTILMIATAVSYGSSLLGTAVTAMRSFRPQVPIHLANTMVVLISSLVLIRQYGLKGAAWAVLIGAGFSTVMYAAITVYKARSKR